MRAFLRLLVLALLALLAFVADARPAVDGANFGTDAPWSTSDEDARAFDAAAFEQARAPPAEWLAQSSYTTPNGCTPANVWFSGGTYFARSCLPLLGFSLDLQNSIVPEYARGSATPTFTRATTAPVTDWEGIVRTALSGEARFRGARRVHNDITHPETPADASWGVDNGGTGSIAVKTPAYAAAPDGTQTAVRVQWNRGAGTTASDYSRATVAGDPFPEYSGTAIHSFWAKSTSGGSVVVAVQYTTAYANVQTITINGTWRRYATSAFAVPPTYTLGFGWGAWGANGDQTGDILVWHPQVENITGQSNQAPGEYVSRNVLASPWHGAGVDGIKYFKTLNGNTVSSNVVTEATGALITNANSSYADAKGPFGYLVEGQRTNEVLWNRDLTNVAWTPTDATVAKNQVGIDGAASSASLITATGANATVLQSITEGSAARRLSAFVKCVTCTGEIDLTEDGGSTWTNVASLLNSSTYTRVSTPAQTVTNPSVGFRIVASGDKIAVDYVQNEAGTYLTSPIATTTVAVTRNMDLLQYPAAGNVPSVGSYYAEASVSWIAGVERFDGGKFTVVTTQPSLTANGGPLFIMVSGSNITPVLVNTSDAIEFYGCSNTGSMVIPNDGTVSSFSTTSIGPGSSGCYFSLNGVYYPNTNGESHGPLDVGTTMTVGINPGGLSALVGTVRRIRMWTSPLSPTQVQAIAFDNAFMPGRVAWLDSYRRLAANDDRFYLQANGGAR